MRRAAAEALRSNAWSIPLESFDWTRSTRDNYQQPGGQSHGRFAAIRDALDASYHGTYSKARQLLQDEWIASVLSQGEPQAYPWIIFSAGAMGAGKTRTVQWMSERGLFPVRQMVHLDPDIFRAALPEWRGYAKRDRLSAGEHTRRESGYLVEIAQEAALRAGKHVWVDGSLRDGEWYRAVLQRIRERHPRHRIAIVHVVAGAEVVLERVRRRAAATGREVPEHEVLDSIARVPQAVALLANEAAFLAVIDNSAETPQLLKYCDEQQQCYEQPRDCWVQIKRRFRSVPQPPPAECADGRADAGGGGGGAAADAPSSSSAAAVGGDVVGAVQRAWSKVTASTPCRPAPEPDLWRKRDCASGGGEDDAGVVESTKPAVGRRLNMNSRL